MERQKSIEPKARRDGGRASDDPTGEMGTLERYFGELAGHSLLTQAQEVELAQQIEEREVGTWRALLGYAGALHVIAESLDPELASLKELSPLRKAAHAKAKTALSERTVEKLSRVLRDHDTSRAALPEVCARVQATFAEHPSARRYLARVEKAKAAHTQAKNRMVTANLRLVVAMARRYDHGLMPLVDLVQEGNIGLMRAVERFDYRRGFRFSTYAAWWIRHALNRGLSDRGRLVRVPVHAFDDAQRISKLAAARAALTGERPDIEEIAEETGITAEKLAFLREHVVGSQPSSLDRPLSADSDTTMLDTLTASDESTTDEEVDLARWRAGIDGILHALTPMEADIVRSRFGLDDAEELTLREIGTKYNLSRERIRQLQEQALLKLRRELERNRGAWEGAAA